VVRSPGPPVRFAGEWEVFEDGFAQLEGHAALAAAIGCQDLLAILPASSEVSKAELCPLVVERLRACAEVLAAHGLRLAVEFYGPLHMRRLHPYPFVFSLGETLEVVGYYGFVSPEVFGPRPAEVSPGDGARLALESIRAAMKAGGRPVDIVSGERGQLVVAQAACIGLRVDFDVAFASAYRPGE
jgi:sugar phosphate isomerase/epimerase